MTVLQNDGHPVIHLQLDDIYDLGGQFFLWEFATAVASHFLEINPFDQPNVESAKTLARDMTAEYLQNGSLPETHTAQLSRDTLKDFLTGYKPGDYIAIQAFLQPTAAVEFFYKNLGRSLKQHQCSYNPGIWSKIFALHRSAS